MLKFPAALRHQSLRTLLLSVALLAMATAAHAFPQAFISSAPDPVAELNNFFLSASGSVTDPGEVIVNYLVERVSTNGQPDPQVLWNQIDAPGGFNLQAPEVPFSGGNQVFRLTVTSVDSTNQTTTAVAETTVHITNVNKAPSANAGTDFNTREFRTGVQLNGSGSDPDGTIASYAWTQTGGTAVTLSNANIAAPTFTAPAAPTTLTFQLIVKDNEGLDSAPASVNVNVQANVAPSVSGSAQPSQPFEGATVALNGTANDANNDPLTFQWVQLSGPQTITITNSTAINATFTAPAVGPAGEVYTFQLTASDGLASTPSAPVTVTVKNQNQNPVSNPTTPSTTVNEGTTVQLFGGASSDPDGDPLTFSWLQNQGPTVTLTGATSSSATWVAPAVTVTTAFRFRLTVEDGQGGSDAKNITINVQHVVASNNPPTVTIAPRQPVTAGAVVTLQANAIDPDNDPLTFQWDQQVFPFTNIINSTNSTASFIAPTVSGNTTFKFRVTVGDGRGGIATASISVMVLDPAAAASGLPLVSNPKTFPSPFSPARGGATIRYTLRSPCDVTILISDIFGRQVREFRQNNGSQGGTSGDNDVHWDGKNGDGELVSNGAYIIQIRAQDGLGAQGKVTDRVGVRR